MDQKQIKLDESIQNYNYSRKDSFKIPKNVMKHKRAYQQIVKQPKELVDQELKIETKNIVINKQEFRRT